MKLIILMICLSSFAEDFRVNDNEEAGTACMTSSIEGSSRNTFFLPPSPDKTNTETFVNDWDQSDQKERFNMPIRTPQETGVSGYLTPSNRVPDTKPDPFAPKSSVTPEPAAKIAFIALLIYLLFLCFKEIKKKNN